MTGRLPHSLRSDARDNRQRILDAACAVFFPELIWMDGAVESGLDAAAEMAEVLANA